MFKSVWTATVTLVLLGALWLAVPVAPAEAQRGWHGSYGYSSVPYGYYGYRWYYPGGYGYQPMYRGYGYGPGYGYYPGFQAGYGYGMNFSARDFGYGPAGVFDFLR
ncbi:MAG: hypothetical protein GXY83_43850 [Rhodopirellula sp.]|mgnify:CR=1 FL=1|nr:hypothetical protein [Rhodopirellula sp.]